MAAILTSWKTTIAGIVLVILGMVLLLFGSGDNAGVQGAALIVAGIGLVTARDANKSSEQSEIK